MSMFQMKMCFENSKSHECNSIFFLCFQDNFQDWFISKEFVNNRTGDVFVGVVSIKMADVTKTVPITDEVTCEESGIMSQVAKIFF